MYILEDIELFHKHSSNPDAGLEALVLLNNGFHYSVTIFDNYADWKKIEVLEDQYTNEELEAIESELFYIYKKNYSIPRTLLHISPMETGQTGRDMGLPD